MRNQSWMGWMDGWMIHKTAIRTKRSCGCKSNTVSTCIEEMGHLLIHSTRRISP